MAKFYKGTEIKFAINLNAIGFSMDEDEFEIEVSTPRASLKGYKTPPQDASTDLIIFEEIGIAGDSSDDSSDAGTASTWYGIVNTSKLSTGEMRVIATAHIPDANAADGIRDEIAVAVLGTLANA